MKILTKNLSYILIFGLILITLILGYAIGKQYVNTQTTPTPSPSVSKLLPTDLTLDERSLLSPPGPGAPELEIEKHASLAAKLSQESNTLDITGCRAKPISLRIKLGTNLDIKNSDEVIHKISIDESHQYTLKPKSQMNIKAEFSRSTGLYGYLCEGVGLIGFILVYN